LVSQPSLSVQSTEFIHFEIEGYDPTRQKKALQLLAKVIRAGNVIRAVDRLRLEKSIVGLLHSSSDEKVIRWCLNCLALFGTRDLSEHAVLLALDDHQHQTEIVAAGIAALSNFTSGELPDTKLIKGISPEIKTLAALQNCPPDLIDFRDVKIDLDKADPEILKLALIVVGLDRAYPNIFHPKHPNEAFVKELGQHDDSIVVQYSVWSAIANPNFSTKDVGVDPADLEILPDNVQSKYLQLIAQKERDLNLRQDLIGRGCLLPSVTAREGLAQGILYGYYEGLEEVTVDWYDQEKSDAVKRRLAEHFSRHSMSSSVYYNKVQEIFECEAGYRKDILLGAEKTKLFPVLKAKDIEKSTLDMFGDGVGSEIIETISQTPTSAQLPIKTVLMFFAAPIDQRNLDLDEEKKEIEASLKGVNKVECEIDIRAIFKAQASDIHPNILKVRPEILHFSGHGNGDCLAFENPNSKTSVAAGESLLKLCTLYKDTIQCVVLNSCHSQKILAQLPDEIPNMIGCKESIDNYAAKKFSANFYGALKAGRGVEQAFEAAVYQLELSGLKAEAVKYSIMKQGS